MKLNEMSIVSDIGRSMTGRVSGKQQIRRVALRALQTAADTLDPRELRRMLEETDPESVIEFLNQRVRREAIEAIKMIKAVED